MNVPNKEQTEQESSFLSCATYGTMHKNINNTPLMCSKWHMIKSLNTTHINEREKILYRT